jgi:hypothetical protein
MLPQISGHGNFGSIDDDPAAAMRYTECRLRPLASDALLADLDADTVDFVPTFDASQVRRAHAVAMQYSRRCTRHAARSHAPVPCTCCHAIMHFLWLLQPGLRLHSSLWLEAQALLSCACTSPASPSQTLHTLSKCHAPVSWPHTTTPDWPIPHA